MNWPWCLITTRTTTPLGWLQTLLMNCPLHSLMEREATSIGLGSTRLTISRQILSSHRMASLSPNTLASGDPNSLTLLRDSVSEQLLRQAINSKDLLLQDRLPLLLFPIFTHLPPPTKLFPRPSPGNCLHVNNSFRSCVKRMCVLLAVSTAPTASVSTTTGDVTESTTVETDQMRLTVQEGVIFIKSPRETKCSR